MADFTAAFDPQDIYDGGPGNDTYTGTANADTINGNGGNDTLAGGGGADTINGGDGDDRLYSYLPQAPQDVTILGPRSLDIFADQDTLIGGAGNDMLIAGYGDSIDGGDGQDSLFINFRGAASGITVDFRNLSGTMPMTIGGGTIANVEAVIVVDGSDFADTIHGGDTAGTGAYTFGSIYGNGGNDRLTAGYYTMLMDGGAGDDVVDSRNCGYISSVYGGDGDDTLYGEPNSFVKVYGGNGNDTIYSGGETYGGAGNDTIELQLGYYSGNVYGEDGDDIIRGVSNYNSVGNAISGGGGADTITGGIDADKLSSGDLIGSATGPALDIGTEHDHIEGGAGNDIIAIGYGDDADGGTGTADVLYLSLQGAASGVTLDTTAIVSGASVAIGGGTIVNFDSVGQLYGSNFADTLTLAAQSSSVVVHGGLGDDTITSIGAGNTMYGDAGNDTLNGGTGDDRFYGGSGGDVMRGNDGSDIFFVLATGDVGAGEVIDGGAGSDTLQVGDGITSVDSIDISAATLTSIERLTSRRVDSIAMTVAQLGAINVIDASSLATITLTDSGNVSLAGHTLVTNLFFVLANGSNTFDLTGLVSTSFTPRVMGGSGADTLISGAGIDYLFGGAGNDVLTGGMNDQLTGGLGDDRFIITSAQIDISENANEGFDTVSAGFTYTLVSNNLEALELTGTGNFDGTGNVADNVITGNEGANHLYGMNGNDTLDGRAGADILEGGFGNDTFVLTDLNDTIIENAGAGIDTVQLTLAAGGSYTLGANLENLTLFGGAFEAHGNAADNIIVGGNTASSLVGEAGNDTLASGTGNDNLYGGLGNDTYRVDQQADLVFENASEGTDSVISTANFYLYANIENLTLASGAGNIFGVGNELANTITGNGGDNTLLAGAGADVVRGGAGIDIIYGEDGNDVLLGDADNDFLAGGAGDDVMNGGTGGDSVYGEAGNDTLTGGASFEFDILVGGDGNDVLRGDSGFGDYDYLYGNAGDDSFYVDTGDDLTFEQAGEGTDTVYATVAGANNGVYLYANIENLVLLGTTTFGVGNGLANTMTGNASGNYLLGGGGNDVLNGKAGNDVLFGEAGADIFVFEHGTGGDVVGDFVPGTDRIDLSAIGYTWQQVQNSFHQNGNDLAIDLGGGDLIVLQGVNQSQLQQSDFILAGGSSGAAPIDETHTTKSDVMSGDHFGMVAGERHGHLFHDWFPPDNMPLMMPLV